MTTKVTFKLPSEFVANASDGVLLGEFNNWNPAEGVQLKKEADGSMFAEIALIAGKSYQYRYLLNDGRWVNDYNTTTSSDIYGNAVENCIVNVPVAEKKKAAAVVTAAKVVAPKAAAVKATSAKVAAPKAAAVKATSAKEAAPKAAAKATVPKAAVSKKKAV